MNQDEVFKVWLDAEKRFKELNYFLRWELHKLSDRELKIVHANLCELRLAEDSIKRTFEKLDR